MTDSACTRWHGAMAMDVLGALPPHERAGLLAHLDGCQACRNEVRDLRSTASLLDLVQPASHDQDASVSPELTGRVLGDLHRGASLARRRRRAGMAAALVGAAVAASLVALAALSSTTPSGPVLSERLVGSTAATATATLAARPWGTAVTLIEHGVQAPGLYTVSMRTASGTWWPTGSYTWASGEPIRAQMTCGVQLSQITGVRVTDAHGAQVLWSESASVLHW